jgi:hypothetical protein
MGTTVEVIRSAPTHLWSTPKTKFRLEDGYLSIVCSIVVVETTNSSREGFSSLDLISLVLGHNSLAESMKSDTKRLRGVIVVPRGARPPVSHLVLASPRVVVLVSFFVELLFSSNEVVSPYQIATS